MWELAADTETERFAPGNMAPRIACTTWASEGANGILSAEESRSWWKSLLEDTNVRIVGQFFAYDTAVVCSNFPELTPFVFAAYDADRITDTKIVQQLVDIGQGQFRGKQLPNGEWQQNGYGLLNLSMRHMGKFLSKDGWRRRYGEFISTPLSGWVDKAKELINDARLEVDVFDEAVRARGILNKPKALEVFTKERYPDGELTDLRAIIRDAPEQVLIYPKEDAISTLEVRTAQRGYPPALLVDQYNQARYSFSQHLMSVHGIRTCPEGVAALRTKIEADIVEVSQTLQTAGLVKWKDKKQTVLQKDTKVAKARMVEVCKTNSIPLRLTKETKKSAGGNICLDEEACNATEDPLLMAYAKYAGLRKVIDNDIKMLEGGIYHPIHTRFDLAETTRTTSSGPNLMNPSKKGGIRECFVPRPGKVFAQADYPQLELYTLAQCCMTWFGFSDLAVSLNAGMDPHLELGSRIINLPYDEAMSRYKAGDEEVKNARNLGKVGNFGRMGGLGAPRLSEYAWAMFKIKISEDRARELIEYHAAQWSEMKPFFARVRALTNNVAKRATVVAPGSGRIRANCKYTEACNDGPQTLGACCAKRAGWLLARAEYAEPESVLFGSRTVLFLHDEYFLETDDSPKAHDVAMDLIRIMAKGANEYLPDVPIPVSKFEPTLMRRWQKDAKPVFDSNNRLIPWEGKAA